MMRPSSAAPSSYTSSATSTSASEAELRLRLLQAKTKLATGTRTRNPTANVDLRPSDIETPSTSILPLAASTTSSEQAAHKPDESDAEEGEINEDEQTNLTPLQPVLERNRPASLPTTISIVDDVHPEFSMDQLNAWYGGRKNTEPARPGVLDDSLTVADYTEAQLLILDILSTGLPSTYLIDHAGISPQLVAVIFSELNLRLPSNIKSEDIPPLPNGTSLPSSFLAAGLSADQIQRKPQIPNSTGRSRPTRFGASIKDQPLSASPSAPSSSADASATLQSGSSSPPPDRNVAEVTRTVPDVKPNGAFPVPVFISHPTETDLPGDARSDTHPHPLPPTPPAELQTTDQAAIPRLTTSTSPSHGEKMELLRAQLRERRSKTRVSPVNETMPEHEFATHLQTPQERQTLREAQSVPMEDVVTSPHEIEAPESLRTDPSLSVMEEGRSEKAEPNSSQTPTVVNADNAPRDLKNLLLQERLAKMKAMQAVRRSTEPNVATPSSSSDAPAALSSEPDFPLNPNAAPFVPPEVEHKKSKRGSKRNKKRKHHEASDVDFAAPAVDTLDYGYTPMGTEFPMDGPLNDFQRAQFNAMFNPPTVVSTDPMQFYDGGNGGLPEYFLPWPSPQYPLSPPHSSIPAQVPDPVPSIAEPVVAPVPRPPIRSNTTPQSVRPAKRLRAVDLIEESDWNTDSAVPSARGTPRPGDVYSTGRGRLIPLGLVEPRLVIQVSDDESEGSENEAPPEPTKKSISPSSEDKDQLVDAFLQPLMDELDKSRSVSVMPEGDTGPPAKDIHEEIRKLKEQIAAAEARKKMKDRQSTLSPVVSATVRPSESLSTAALSTHRPDLLSTFDSLNSSARTTLLSTDDAPLTPKEDTLRPLSHSPAPIVGDLPDYEDDPGDIFVIDADGDQSMVDLSHRAMGMSAPSSNSAIAGETRELLIHNPPPKEGDTRTVNESDRTQSTSRMPSPVHRTSSTSRELSLPSAPASNVQHYFSPLSTPVPTSLWSNYHSPFGWYNTATPYMNTPPAPEHTVSHKQGTLDLMPLRMQVLSRHSPGSVLCHFEVPGGGTCMDPSCPDTHLRDLQPTDDETAEYLAGIFPAFDVGQLQGALLGARRPGPAYLQDFTSRVADALSLLGLR